LTRAEGRRFAWTLAAGLSALGAVLAWRGRGGGAAVLWSAAAILAVAGLVVPSRLGPMQRAWLRLGVALSRVTAPIFFAALYFLIVTPVGVLRRTLGRSPLERTPGARTFWVKRAPVSPQDARNGMERQF
jgi:hypothetical protein